MRRLWSVLVSLRTTATLLVVVTALLLLNVVLPQRTVEPEGFAAAARSGAGRFVLVTLGLGQVSTSLLFVASLAAFFVNLAAVLVDRLGTTVRRVRFAPPSAAQLEGLLAGASVAGPRSGGISEEDAPEALRRIGYRAVAVGEGTVWGVKHRLALLGFPVFHASFFFMCAGAVQLYLTRDVVTVLGAEGQPLDTRRGAILRRAPVGPPDPVQLTIERVDVRLESGRPVDLAATFTRAGEGLAFTTRINHPARWDATTVLVRRAGIAPVLWLTDANGFTLDRVAVPVASTNGLPQRVPLGGGDVEVVIEPIPVGAGFPERDALPRAAVTMRVRVAGKTAFEGKLRPGESVDLGGRVLALQEVRYFAALDLVSERGGGLLVLGFVLSVVGISWRMLWYRREVVARWEGDVVRIAGRAEFYQGRFRDELGEIARLLAPSGSPPGSGRAA